MMTQSKLDDYEDNMLAEYIAKISDKFNSNPKFMKGFMDLEYDPFVVQMNGDEGWQIYPCGNAYVWLDEHILLLIQEWIEEMEPEWDEYMAEFDAELEAEESEEKKVVLITNSHSQS